MLKLLLTCEHGGNRIPPDYASLFEGQEDLLATHRGYDIGALALFHHLKELADESYFAVESRLLVELNRSVGQEDLLSEATRMLSATEKEHLLQQHYYPYRNQVEQIVMQHVIAGNQVLHIALHSFTPELNGEIRQADIGLLYDPDREQEHLFCKAWKEAFEKAEPALLVRYNYPYLGTADGFPTYLRQKFEASRYSGIELEVNQKFAQGPPEQWAKIKSIFYQTLREATEIYAKSISENNA